VSNAKQPDETQCPHGASPCECLSRVGGAKHGVALASCKQRRAIAQRLITSDLTRKVTFDKQLTHYKPISKTVQDKHVFSMIEKWIENHTRSIAVHCWRPPRISITEITPFYVFWSSFIYLEWLKLESLNCVQQYAILSGSLGWHTSTQGARLTQRDPF